MFDKFLRNISGTVRDQEAMLQAVHASQAVIEFDLDGTIRTANDNFLKAMGYTLTEVQGRPHSIFVEPEYKTSSEYARFWEALGRGEHQAGEYRRVAKDGSEVWIQATYTPILDAGGKPFKIVKFAVDITAQKQRDADYQGQIEAIHKSQAVIEFDLDGTIRTANDNFLKAMGYTLTEVQGRPHSIFVEPEYKTSSEYARFWEALGRGEHQAGEYRRVAKDGSEVWIQATYTPILDAGGKPFKVVKFAVDITAQKQRDADYRGQIEAIHKAQAVIEFDLDGTIRTANANFLQAMGYTLGEVQGRHHSIFVEPEYKASAEYSAFWEALRRGEHQGGECKRIAKGGRAVWIQATYNLILDPSGRPLKVVKFASDVTERVTARMERERIGGEVADSLNKILSSVTTVTDKSASATSASSQTEATVQAVASAAEQSDASLREISESMIVSQKAVAEMMTQTEAADQSTQALNSAAEAMNTIVELIQDIAGQINLLALNATIESARAGEAGKGFAVVANEVKNLASEVAKATDQIAGEISGMQSIAGDVVDKLQTINTAVGQVQSSVTSVAGSIDEQSAATKEISSNMQTAAIAVSEINQGLSDISASVGTVNDHAAGGVELCRVLQSV